jgi:hypothetical protein
MPVFTLDTSCVIHAVQHQAEAGPVERLVDAAREDRVILWLTAAFAADQTRASSEHLRANLDWLADRPVNQASSGPFRLDYSQLDGPDVLIDGETAEIISIIEEVLLPPAYRVGHLDASDQSLMERWRRKINDVQHLAAHHMAGHDAFVTSDFDDMVKKRQDLWTRANIGVLTPTEAVKSLDA